MKRSKKPLRVGFDLDGVILYNPARIVRRPVRTFKHFFFPKIEGQFHIPHKPWEKFIWHIFHFSSFRVSPGFWDVAGLRKKGLVEPYVITARYGFLKNDFQRWVQKLRLPTDFHGYFMNEKDEQPHEFKERMIKELKLDVFVEDNLDIVRHLRKTTDAEILWVYNIFDLFVHDNKKYPDLKKAVEYIASHAKKK